MKRRACRYGYGDGTKGVSSCKTARGCYMSQPSVRPIGTGAGPTLAFLRLSTHPAVFPRPLAPAQAADVVERWLGTPAALTIEPTRRHLPLLRGPLERAGTAGNLVSDAHLAPLALERGAKVVSFDRDFPRFEEVALRRPG